MCSSVLVVMMNLNCGAEEAGRRDVSQNMAGKWPIL